MQSEFGLSEESLLHGGSCTPAQSSSAQVMLSHKPRHHSPTLAVGKGFAGHGQGWVMYLFCPESC